MTSTTLPRSDVSGLSAIVAGQGRPVILLHGVGLRAEAWADQIAVLCKEFRAIAPDMPGHGGSARPTAAFALSDYALAVLPVLEGLGEPALVVGHSMGALVALDLAYRAPERVCAVIALNAVFERSPEAAVAVRARAAELDGIAVPDPTPTLTRWFGATRSPQRTACEEWLRTGDPAGYQLAYTAFAQCDGPDRGVLQNLKCPALFATGGLEPNSTPEMSRAMAGLAPCGRALIVEGAAHMMPMTHPNEVTAAIVGLAREVWS